MLGRQLNRRPNVRAFMLQLQQGIEHGLHVVITFSVLER